MARSEPPPSLLPAARVVPDAAGTALGGLPSLVVFGAVLRPQHLLMVAAAAMFLGWRGLMVGAILCECLRGACILHLLSAASVTCAFVRSGCSWQCVGRGRAWRTVRWPQFGALVGQVHMPMGVLLV